jgi:hypothetical protein
MMAPWTPMRWPAAWKDPSTLELLKGTAIDYLLIEDGATFDAVRVQARKQGLQTGVPDREVAGVTAIKGEWPGVKMARPGSGGVTAGPTGIPWVDSNGWQIRLASALHPEAAVWVNAAPPESLRGSAGAYLVAIADSGAYGGRWVIALDEQLVSGLPAQRSEALTTWRTIATAAAFFAERKAWAGYTPMAVVGVVSDFSGPNEFFSQELLNLLARAGQHYRILRKDGPAAPRLEGLRAVIYADGQQPSPALRKQVLSFVEAGGMLIASPQWGAAPGAAAKPDDEGPLFSVRSVGKGRVALARSAPDDPYQWANDSVVLVSHRYDMVRFWNGGATGSFPIMAPDGKRAVAHLLFYSNRGPDAASVRIAGRFRAAKAWTVEGALPRVETEIQRDAIEVHLPQAPQYVALEMEA